MHVLVRKRSKSFENGSKYVFCKEQYRQLGREVPQRSDSEESFHFLESCYKTCVQEHPECQQSSLVLPKRVIDISTNSYRLVEPTTGSRGVYAALSYIWGGWENFTTRKMVEQFKKEIAPESMPTVFQECAAVARRLKIPYLWIDSVCIIQDDIQDWSQEVAKMADIFEHAGIVIAASAAPNPGKSFLGQRVTPVLPPIRLNVHSSLAVEFKARKSIGTGMHSSNSPTSKDLLDHRGWVLQEKELACRWVSYSASEIQWTCKTLQFCECCAKPSSSRRFISGSNVALEELHYIWHLVVQDYTSRNLTKQDDKLSALMGLAKKFNQLTNEMYIFGLWKETLIDDLVWKRDLATNFYPPSMYLAPTFSWASILDGASYQPARSLYKGIRTYHTEVLDVQSFSSTAKGNWIILQGPVLDVTLSSSNTRDSHAYYLTVGPFQYPSDLYFGPDKGRSGCEFTVDSPLATQDSVKAEEAVGKQSVQRWELGTEISDVFTAISVRLLSLHTLFQPTEDVIYENFLILGRDPNNASMYQRIGLGTGKIYLTASQSLSTPDSPFLWTNDVDDRNVELGKNHVVEDVRIV
jgi:Heterokaryon incompatibility protein (HET)